MARKVKGRSGSIPVREAALEAGGEKLLLGDIEVRRRARDWLAHGHHTDQRYNGVMVPVALGAASSRSPLAARRWSRCPDSLPQLYQRVTFSLTGLAMRQYVRTHRRGDAEVVSAMGRNRAFRAACSRLRRCVIARHI
jgi:hypothetical protein